MTADGTPSVQALTRAMDIMAAMQAVGGSMTISEIAARTGLAAGTVHRLARTLVSGGYLRQLPDRSYYLGSRLISLGIAANSMIGPRARPALHDLAAEIGESANLAIMSNHTAEYVAQSPGLYSMRMFTEVGRHVPLHCTGVGKALLSGLSDSAIRQLMSQTGMPQRTHNTITDIDRLLPELDIARARGYVVDDAEMEDGVRCVAAPVQAMVPMAVSVSSPSSRMNDEAIERAAHAVRTASLALAKVLAE